MAKKNFSFFDQFSNGLSKVQMCTFNENQNLTCYVLIYIYIKFDSAHQDESFNKYNFNKLMAKNIFFWIIFFS